LSLISQKQVSGSLIALRSAGRQCERAAWRADCKTGSRNKPDNKTGSRNNESRGLPGFRIDADYFFLAFAFFAFFFAIT
jgi:hypothetical protein